MNKQLIEVFQITLGIVLVCLIILQAKGSGLGSTFGSNLSLYSSRRGVEKLIFNLTIATAFFFLAASLIGVIG